MSENWNEILQNEPIDLSPRSGFESELRLRLTDEWNGRPVVTPTTTPEAASRPTRRGWLFGAAAAAVLVIGGVVFATRPGADSTVQTPVSDPEPSATTSPDVETTDPVVEPAPQITESSRAPNTTEASDAPNTTTQDSSAPSTAEASRTGEEIGFGSIGPPIAVPQPWSSIATIYTDLEPQTLIVDFNPPNQQCIAAQASATIGRGGAILVNLFVDSERADGPCPDSADSNRIRIPLSEPLGDRRIYTSAEAETEAASQAIDQLADSVIGLDVADAEAAIRAAGFEVRDITGLDAVEDDLNPNRINISATNGVVDFAAVY